ncbi:MAG: hypothetical protein LBD43_01685 [Holosporales bacterium]|nr:hypothetical protein [Holosporales bacterium]
MVCVEEILEKHQAEYYETLQDSDKTGSSEKFIEFMLGVICRHPQFWNHRFNRALWRSLKIA